MGADPTEAAPDQTNRGVGLIKIRASRSISRDSALGTGVAGVRVEGLRYDLRAKARSRAAVSHHLVQPRYRAVFSLFSIEDDGRDRE